MILLLASGATIRWQAHVRAEGLIATEEQALATFASLHRASRAAVGRGPHPGLAALLAEHPRLHLLDEVSTTDLQYATDERYVFGLLRSTRRNAAGEIVHGYVLRAWPWIFGETGDLEYHIDERGAFYRGQNDLGRSGLEEGFPPPFPQPRIAEGLNAAWWQSHLPD